MLPIACQKSPWTEITFCRELPMCRSKIQDDRIAKIELKSKKYCVFQTFPAISKGTAHRPFPTHAVLRQQFFDSLGGGMNAAPTKKA